MAPRIAPPSRNAAAQALLELYQSTERRIIQEIARKRTQGYVDYAELAALRRVRKTIQQMVDKSAKYVPLAIEHEFYKGEGARKGYENALGMTEGAAERDRVAEQLVDNLMGEVQEMAQTAYQSAEAQVLGRVDPGVYRQSVLRGAIVSETMGRGSLSTVEEVMRNLQAAGITAFVDKAGREWSLSAYGAMAVRTTVRQAQVSAVLTADDHDLWKIKEIGSTCPLCAVYEGRVYSKSGMNPNYPPLAAAFGKMDPAGPNDLSNTFLNIHPSCQHSLVRWTEDYKTDEEIRQAREFSSFETNPKTNDPRTEAQIEAYRNKERQRAAYRRDVKQFERYTRASIEDFPKSMATFLKHKQADDDKYKAWLAEYRKIEKPKKPKVPEIPPIKFEFKNPERYSKVRGIIENLAQEYRTRLQTVTSGVKNLAGQVDPTGATMRINSVTPDVAIHEFAHTLATTSADKLGLTHDQDFWKEIRKIRTDYRKAFRNNTSLMISAYADGENKLDEFMAEAFTHAKLRELGLPIPQSYGDDFTYSQKVLNVVNRYFGRKK